ncbi:hypothetical protein JMA_34470 [Jeotgalibacillus malaysiensis]|uniref:Uncharacterized protein n=1 Tax=Jeotgalibacillus malaysiensis TaxID=1508404 RepID=A0A0B5AR90_9BACL|nr:hypothetical protein JMA_34470 [Jeotgalibacillus malaysiensis]
MLLLQFTPSFKTIHAVTSFSLAYYHYFIKNMKYNNEMGS